MKKIISYMERKIPFYFTAMLVPMLLFGAICVFIEITPFGDHSFLIADMEKQYLDFFPIISRFFKESIIFSIPSVNVWVAICWACMFIISTVR